MNNIALFPGTFDPFTIGHENIVRRSLNLFDQIIIGIGKNNSKNTLFSIEKRLDWIKNTFRDEKKVSVVTYAGLTIEYCRLNQIRYILRGLRSASDFEFEKNIASVNRFMDPAIETIFISSLPEHASISSTIIREIILNGGNANHFVPKSIQLD